MRLDKWVAERFGLSRREAQEAVRRGQVDVAGQTCLEPGREIDARDSGVLIVPTVRARKRCAATAGSV